jgi:hypothetical protein
MKKAMVMGTLVTLVLVAGCYYAPGGIAPSNTPIGNRSYNIVDTDVEAQDCVWRLFGILPVSGRNSTQDAVEEALQGSKSDALIDVTVEGVNKYYIVISSGCTVVHGKGIRFQ